MRLWNAILIAAPLTVVACTGGNSSTATGTGSASTGRTIARVDGPEAKKLVAAGALLVDVRSPEEFADGHIEGARNIPLDTLGRAMADLPKDKPIVVYCAVGSRSSMAAGMLAGRGYDVKNLGAMANWH